MPRKTKEERHQYYMENRERIRQLKRDAYWKDIEGGRQRAADYRKKIRMELILLLGGVCWKCGFSDVRALQVDHIHGGGSYHNRHGSNATYYKKIIGEIKAGSKDYALLCANCNTIKKYENHEGIR